MGIFWATSPPAELEQGGIRVHWVRAGESSRFRFLAGWQAVWTHWVETKTVPCNGAGCPFCASHVPQRWLAYAPALRFAAAQVLEEVERTNASGEKYRKTVSVERGTWSAVVLEVTEAMAAALQGRKLRGMQVRASRDSARRNAAVRVHIIDQDAPADLPPAFDVRPILLRMWGQRPRAGAGNGADLGISSPSAR